MANSDSKLLKKSFILYMTILSLFLLISLNIVSFFYVLSLFDEFIAKLAMYLGITTGLQVPFTTLYLTNLQLVYILIFLMLFLVVLIYVSYFSKDSKKK